jgi:hypothetical protein
MGRLAVVCSAAGMVVRRPNLGSQYVSAAYLDLLTKPAVRSSVGCPGTCRNTSAPQSFFAKLKRELVHRCTWPNSPRCQIGNLSYVVGILSHRRHSRLGYRSRQLSSSTIERLR